MKKITTPLTDENVRSLRAGEEVLLSGTIYTARDAAHKRLISLLDRKESLPLDLSGQILYYTGPTPSRPGRVIGSAGPTTSSRMDKYTPQLLSSTGLKGMIGKGSRSDDVIRSMGENCCVYFAAAGGAGALLAEHIEAAETVAYSDLGPEAIYKLGTRDFPLIVAIDCFGNNLYLEGPRRFRNSG